MSVLIVTEEDEFGQKLSAHIKSSSEESANKVMTISHTQLSNVLSDPFWGDSSPSRIYHVVQQIICVLDNNRHHVYSCCK